MYQVAKEIDLPASFVELRHQATHEDLPSLVVLRRATTRALEWLWDYYWHYQGEPTEDLGVLNRAALFASDEKNESLEGNKEKGRAAVPEDEDDTNEGIYKWEGPWLPRPIGCG